MIKSRSSGFHAQSAIAESFNLSFHCVIGGLYTAPMKAGLAFLLKPMRWQKPKIDLSNTTHATNQNSRSPNCPNLETGTFQHSPSIDYTEAAILGNSTVRHDLWYS
jgi:hypothetical protein